MNKHASCVQMDIVIGTKTFSRFESLTLTQSTTSHHRFELVLPSDTLKEASRFNPDHRENSWMDEARQLLGQPLTIAFYYQHTPDEKRYFHGIVTHLEYNRPAYSYGSLVLSGGSPTLLLDAAPHIQSFTSHNLHSIAEKLLAQCGGNIPHELNPAHQSSLPYSCQYNETAYNYLSRLAAQWGEWFYYSGEKLHLGKPCVGTDQLTLVYGRDVQQVHTHMDTIHTNRNQWGYSSSDDRLLSPASFEINGLDDMGAYALQTSQNLYDSPSLQPAPTGQTNLNSHVSTTARSLNEAIASELFTVQGLCSNPYLYPGCIADLEFYNRNTHKSEYFAGLLITEVEQSLSPDGLYQSRFTAVPAKTRTLPLPRYHQPAAMPQIATVTESSDGEGRVKVQFSWQAEPTDWIRVQAPDAGGSSAVSKNRGFVFIPEVGDQVMVGFEFGNPDMPYVAGSMFHGKIGAGGYADNHLKSITTRSGCTIQIDDTDGQGSIAIKDPSGNSWYMDGKGNIDVKAPKDISINAGHNMEINVGQNMTFNVGNQALLNIMQKMLVQTPFLQQLITTYYHTQAGKALINSENEIKLESPEMFVAGQRKLFLHSDEAATINSKGSVNVKGEAGNNYGNQSVAYEVAKPELTAKCIVHFRPKKNWKGEECGFDWMRTGDTNLVTGGAALFGDNKYEDIVAKQYTDATYVTLVNDINEYKGSFKKDPALYSDLTKDYNVHIIPWKAKKDATGADMKDASGAIIPEEYFCSWLSLYPKYSETTTVEYVEDLNVKDGGSLKEKVVRLETGFANTKTTISLIVDIEEEPDVLRFEDNKYFSITPREIDVKGKGKGKHALANHITIECIKEFSDDQTILINAIKKVVAPVAAEIVLPAGKLKVWANNAAKRKKAKVLLIKVKTPPISDVVKKEGDTTGQKELFENYLRHALIETEVTEETLDLSVDVGDVAKFQGVGDYVNGNLVRAYYTSGAPAGFQNLQTYVYAKLQDQLKLGNPADEHKYDNHFKAIYLGENGGSQTGGSINELNGYSSGKFVVLFPGKNNQTAAHEFLHSFNLPHSFTNKEADADALFTYEYTKTENIMDYTHHVAGHENDRCSLWHWQWIKANNSLV